MLRAAALSIVLALAAGPNASLLCKAWCGSQTAAASECHDHDGDSAAPSVEGGDRCDTMPGAAPFLREGERRDVPAPDAEWTIPVPRFQLPDSPAGARPGQEPGRDWPLEKRPLATALRI